MKRLPVCLLACFLICGVVSAAALIPAAQRTVISVAPSPLPTVRMTIGQAAAAPALNTLNARGTVELGSVPSGADVTIDGADAPSAKTPVKLSLFTGIHTLLLSFPGYNDRTVTVTVAAGSVESVTVTLVPVVARDLDRAGGTLAAIPPVVAAVPRTMVSRTSAVQTPVLLRNISSPVTPAPLSCPSSDWTCMPLSQAGA
ncbi:MAG TPA: PEGA domain-containing protein, partial [Methanoregula sp.]|nr:PEGA domain-containing protein [Methanoregula sp.]